ncbi:hypothetical protein DYB28_012738 [Aphanomyces astaci]|uniref:Uncharacterized protein n=1 Tax=Aphanomyces astaci TaxID=112090 RepID=A0A9X8DU69_APHAT|nr:hypothetical protein DYB28_012738 [Aphanomyces astaci]
MREYQKYLGQMNALQCNGSHPFVMPVRIALFNRDHNSITNYCVSAFEEDIHNLYVLKQRLQRAICFDMKILDAGSRFCRMLDEVMRSLEQDHLEWVTKKAKWSSKS